MSATARDRASAIRRAGTRLAATTNVNSTKRVKCRAGPSRRRALAHGASARGRRRLPSPPGGRPGRRSRSEEGAHRLPSRGRERGLGGEGTSPPLRVPGPAEVDRQRRESCPQTIARSVAHQPAARPAPGGPRRAPSCPGSAGTPHRPAPACRQRQQDQRDRDLGEPEAIPNAPAGCYDCGVGIQSDTSHAVEPTAAGVRAASIAGRDEAAVNGPADDADDDQPPGMAAGCSLHAAGARSPSPGPRVRPRARPAVRGGARHPRDRARRRGHRGRGPVDRALRRVRARSRQPRVAPHLPDRPPGRHDDVADDVDARH